MSYDNGIPPDFWPSFIFIRDPKLFLLKIYMEFPDPAPRQTFLAEVYSFRIEEGIGDRKIPVIERLADATMRIYAPDGIRGALQIDRLPYFQHSFGDQAERKYNPNPFYRRVYSEDPVEIYGEIMYFLEGPVTVVRPTFYTMGIHPIFEPAFVRQPQV